MSDAPEERSADKAADAAERLDRDELDRDDVDDDEVDDDRDADDVDDDDTPAIRPARPLIDRRSDRDVANENDEAARMTPPVDPRLPV